ncbi:6-hydroxy-D-nicotine oxidase [Hypoxylon crocopeplum]|nr:6-hydroxy-D-nicotine oxidase [Hypoxylon crocopeplum]
MSSSATATRDILAATLPGCVTAPSDTQYAFERDFPWSPTCWLPAACYVRPRTPDEVATVLKAIRETGSKFAIRCGGHNCNPNMSSVDGSGIVIDIRDLNSISVDKSSGIARIGAGSKWNQVYTSLEENGLTAIGGRQNDVGVGGFLLGGGLGAFSNLYGLGADNIVNFEVVLADSKIVNANSKENPDLYRALKGGGSNFGIVTRFDIQTYEIKAHYTLNVYDPADYANILRATVEAQEVMETDLKYGMFVTFNPNMVVVGLFYADWVSETPTGFQPFLHLKSLVTSAVPPTNGTLKSLVDAIGPTTHLRRQVYTASTKISYDLYVDVHKHWLEMVKKYPDAGNMFYAIQPISATVAQAAEVRGGNTLGIEHMPQTYEAHDTAAKQGINELGSGMTSIAKERGQLLDFIFMNDATASQNVLASYGAGNARRLRETATKYDPEGVFQKLQNDGFLIRKM